MSEGMDKITRDQFIQKLHEASEEVKKWPEWEQNILGGTARPVTPKKVTLIPTPPERKTDK